MNIYENWIERNISIQDIHKKCEETTQKMFAIFPELKQIKGHYIDLWTVKHPHWWLLAPNGKIIDPTKMQFQDCGMGQYVEWQGEEPTGRCQYCAEYVYNNDLFCSTECDNMAIKALNNFIS